MNSPEGMTVHAVQPKPAMRRCPYCKTRRRDGEKCCSAAYAVVNLPAEPLTDSKGGKIDFEKRKHGRPKLKPMKLKEGA
jgi:hypothetical protein